MPFASGSLPRSMTSCPHQVQLGYVGLFCLKECAGALPVPSHLAMCHRTQPQFCSLERQFLCVPLTGNVESS